MPLKCFGDTKYGELSDIVTAIYDAVDTYECDVLNMSFGMEQESAFLNNALRYALSKGTIAVAAVGNEGSAALHYPAACEGVIGVSSVDKVKTVSAFSQKNESVFVAAPGEAVLLLGNSAGQYGYSQGTSYAAPVVSALAAVAYELDEDMTPVRFADVLQNTCEDLGTAGYDTEYGYGLVNAQNMLDYLLCAGTALSHSRIRTATAGCVSRYITTTMRFCRFAVYGRTMPRTVQCCKALKKQSFCCRGRARLRLVMTVIIPN